MTNAALALVEPAIVSTPEHAIAAAYSKAYAAALAPGPRLAEMIEAVDQAAQRIASGQRAALAIYGAAIDEGLVRHTVALSTACDVLMAVRQNITHWPPDVKKVIAQAMGDLAKMTKE